jgi:sn-glycerol 3-phosphate transport system permease protein
MSTVVMGIKRVVPTGDAAAEWNLVMATVVMAMLPPIAIVVLMQRWFIKGLIETEK